VKYFKRILMITAVMALTCPCAAGRLPLVYSGQYDITFYGLEKLHPFDTSKYSKVYKYLVEKAGIDKNSFFEPPIVTDEQLKDVHTQAYLDSLKKSSTLAKIAEFTTLSFIPNTILQRRMLDPMRYATGGTILGAKLALQYGWAINLSGGYHHAKAGSGGGFCVYADIPIAVHELWKKDSSLRVLVVDLDAHQGNGNEMIFKDDKRVSVLDFYNRDIYPNDTEAKLYIRFDYPLRTNIEDDEYISMLKTALPAAIRTAAPGLIIYNAGTDLFEGDLLGEMRISEKGIMDRDEIVFRNALNNKIPILMVLSGGYTKKSSIIIGKSIENIIRNVIGIKK
jgi:histone deacetylase 11